MGGSESDRHRIEPSTVWQLWQMVMWSGRELLIFKIFHLLGVGEWAALRVIGTEYSHIQ